MNINLRKEMKKHGNVFIYGITIIVLIIMAAILTGFIMLPIYGVAYYVNETNYPAFLGAVYLIIAVYMLGFVFMRYRVQKK